MADGFIQNSPDSSGKRLDTSELTVGTNLVERQRLVIADPTNPANLAAVAGGAVNVNIVSGMPQRAGGNGHATKAALIEDLLTAIDARDNEKVTEILRNVIMPLAVGDGFIQVPPDSSGKRIDTSELTVNGLLNERQRVVIADPTSPTGFVGVTGGAINVNVVSGGVPYALLNVASSPTPNFNWATSINQRMILTANAVIAFSSPSITEMTLVLVQDVVGSRNVTWPANIRVFTPIDGTPNTSTVYTFIFDGTNYLLKSSMGGM